MEYDIKSRFWAIACIVRVYMGTNLQQSITKALQEAFGAVLGISPLEVDPVLRRSQNSAHGDYQANGAMALGKKHGIEPKKLANKVVGCVDFGNTALPPETAGPGFINIRLTNETIVSLINDMDDQNLGITKSNNSNPVAIDLCGVNVAKQLHVGHLRSTIIGDSLARMFERTGRKVYRENHLGDWGLPIAMVLERLTAEGADLNKLTLDDLNQAYRDAQLGASDDAKGLSVAIAREAGPHRIVELEEQNASALDFQQLGKETLVALQGGDKKLIQEWEKLIECTMRSVFRSLDLLNVKIGPEHNRGESFYRDRLANIVDLFVSKKLAEEDDGALVVCFGDRKKPMLIRKSDGGFLYATTDLAAVEYRTQELGADSLIYVVDARQREHFKDLFDAARLVGWGETQGGTSVDMVHIPFGSVLGTDKKPLKTRSGSSVTLDYLINEAIERGAAEVLSRAKDPKSQTHKMSKEELWEIGRQVGIGAIKYADLSNDLVRDYVFDIDRMVAFEGNTGPYIQYACARINSLLTKCNDKVGGAEFLISEPEERSLVLELLQYNSVLRGAIKNLEPHRLCTWLYGLTEAFNVFYQNCPVLSVEDDAIRGSRLRLADITRRVLVDGLDVLGLESPKHM